jgi:hypothetical protein
LETEKLAKQRHPFAYEPSSISIHFPFIGYLSPENLCQNPEDRLQHHLNHRPVPAGFSPSLPGEKISPAREVCQREDSHLTFIH